MTQEQLLRDKRTVAELIEALNTLKYPPGHIAVVYDMRASDSWPTRSAPLLGAVLNEFERVIPPNHTQLGALVITAPLDLGSNSSSEASAVLFTAPSFRAPFEAWQWYAAKNPNGNEQTMVSSYIFANNAKPIPSSKALDDATIWLASALNNSCKGSMIVDVTLSRTQQRAANTTGLTVHITSHVADRNFKLATTRGGKSDGNTLVTLDVLQKYVLEATGQTVGTRHTSSFRLGVAQYADSDKAHLVVADKGVYGSDCLTTSRLPYLSKALDALAASMSDRLSLSLELQRITL